MRMEFDILVANKTVYRTEPYEKERVDLIILIRVLLAVGVLCVPSHQNTQNRDPLKVKKSCMGAGRRREMSIS